MKPEQVKQITKNTGYMSLNKGKYLHQMIIDNNIQNVLELGFAHGVSSCYIASALEELNKNCNLDTIDLKSAIDRKPNIKHLLNECNFSDKVEINYYLKKNHIFGG